MSNDSVPARMSRQTDLPATPELPSSGQFEALGYLRLRENAEKNANSGLKSRARVESGLFLYRFGVIRGRPIDIATCCKTSKPVSYRNPEVKIDVKKDRYLNYRGNHANSHQKSILIVKYHYIRCLMPTIMTLGN